MKRLDRVVLVQFFLYDADELPVTGHCAFLGPNGTGKTAVADAIQIAMVGAHGNYVKLNAQRDEGGRERTIREYCLGALDGRFKRDHAQTYITMIFKDTDTGVEDSCGVALTAAKDQPSHVVEGLYVIPGVGLTLADHVERTQDGDLPMRWDDFYQALKMKAKDALTELLVDKRPERYISEMLMALGAGDRINRVDFLKAFRKSVLLRNIQTVDGFVRDFLIDARTIDKQRAMQQIENFKKLSNLVEDVKTRIGDLSGLGKCFDQVLRHIRYAVAYDTAAITLRQEEIIDRHDHLKEVSAELEAALSEGAAQESVLKDEVERLEAESLAIQQALSQSGERQAKLEQEAALSALRREGASHRAAVDRVVLLAEKAAAAVASDTGLAGCAETVQSILSAVSTARSSLDRANLESAESAALSALQLLADLAPAVERAVEAARTSHDAAQDKLREAEGVLKAAERFGVRLGGDTTEAIRMLEEHGITATPVCTQVRVIDRHWQAAVEGFMGPHREALLVPGGKEDDSVTLLLNRQKRLYNAYIVQPEHFQEDLGRGADRDLVGSLLEGDDPVALAYSRKIFGAMRKAYSAADLRRYRQALTADGGVSRSGSTRTIRLEQAENFKLGRKYEPSEAAAMKRELELARQEASVARLAFESRVGIRNKVAEGSDTSRLSGELRQSMAALKGTVDQAKRQAERIAAIDMGKFSQLEQDSGRVLDLLKSAREELIDHARAHGAKTTKLDQARIALETCKVDLAAVGDKARTQLENVDYDAQLADDCKVELEKTKGSDIKVLIAEAESRAEGRRNRFSREREEGMDRFRQFIDQHSYGLLDERRDWRLAATFVSDERTKLEKSDLVQREKEANEARNVAEESFRRDVAISIANAIFDMRAVVRELNRTLDRCPEFTRSERYKFEFQVRPQYKMIHDYILAAAQDEKGDLFGGESEVSKQIIGLLEQAASSAGSKEPNPIDDFRLMFSFDVEILVRGTHQAYLSERVGPGSGGEHKTPFYVIAGAALAHAYRLDSKTGKRGAAVMILDEAFNKMDPQNSYSAARFLDSLGLQLIMTAPDDSFGKLVPFCDRIYEMTRSGMDVFYEVAHIKEPAKRLLRTDMVQEQPELLAQEVARLGGTAPAQ
jgi:chromosome segregation protein